MAEDALQGTAAKTKRNLRKPTINDTDASLVAPKSPTAEPSGTLDRLAPPAAPRASPPSPAGSWESLCLDRKDQDPAGIRAPRAERVGAPWALGVLGGPGEAVGGEGEDQFTVITGAASDASGDRTTSAFSLISNSTTSISNVTTASVMRTLVHWSLESVIRPESPASFFSLYQKHLRQQQRNQQQRQLMMIQESEEKKTCLEEAYWSLQDPGIFSQYHPIDVSPSPEVEEELEEEEEARQAPSPLLWVVSKTVRLPVVLASNVVIFLINRLAPVQE